MWQKMLHHKQKSCTYGKVKVLKCMNILPDSYTKKHLSWSCKQGVPKPTIYDLG